MCKKYDAEFPAACVGGEFVTCVKRITEFS